MITTEEKLNAVMQYIAADSVQNQEQARREVRRMLGISAPPLQETDDDATRRILLELGVKENIKGYSRLVTAICVAAKDPNVLDGLTTKVLYPTVAKIHQDTASKTERAIRHAIETAWSRCDFDVLQCYFGNTVDPNKGRPTNSEFIARIAGIIRRMEQ